MHDFTHVEGKKKPKQDGEQKSEKCKSRGSHES